MYSNYCTELNKLTAKEVLLYLTKLDKEVDLNKVVVVRYDHTVGHDVDCQELVITENSMEIA